MSWSDTIALAMRSVMRRPGRAVLTVLAIALASTLLCALLIISRTAETRVLSQLSKGGPLSGIKVFAAEPDPLEDPTSDNPRRGRGRDIDRSDVRSIEKIAGVERVHAIETIKLRVVEPELFVLSDGSTTVPRPKRSGSSYAQGTIDANAIAIDPAASRDLPLTVTAGRLPAKGSRAEVAVTPHLLAKLGVARERARHAVGADLEVVLIEVSEEGVYRERFEHVRVVGVVAQEAGTGDLVVSQRQLEERRAWHDAVSPAVQPTFSGLFVVAANLDLVPKVRAAIDRKGFATSAPENVIASVLRYLHVVEIVLGSIGFIALAVAALGISNAMLAAVRERRREIGVLKAIGARDRDVTRLFVVEAAALGAAGGVGGALLGLAVARAVGAVVNRYLTDQGLSGVEAVAPWPVLTLVAGGAVVVSAVAGALPARRAARLPAREAVDA